VAVYDRPNLRRSWREADWARPNLIDRYLDALLPVLQAQQASGLRPVLPHSNRAATTGIPPSCRQRSTRSPVARRRPRVRARDRLYAWSHGTHCAGRRRTGHLAGCSAYAEADDSEDQRGIRIFEWYGQIAKASLGVAASMIVLPAGSQPAPTPRRRTR